MRRFMKVCLIAGGVFIIAGSIVTVTAAAMGADVHSGLFFRHNWMGYGMMGEVMDDTMNEVRDGLREANDDLHDMEDELNHIGDEWRWTEDRSNSVGEPFTDHYTGADKDKIGKNRYDYLADSVRKLTIEVNNGRVVLSEDDSIREIVVSSDDDEERWNSGLDGDELKIQSKSGYWNSDDHLAPIIYIRVPKGKRFTQVEVTTALSKKSAFTKTTKNNGPEFHGTGLLADEIDLVCKVGAINLEGSEAGELDINSDVGAVRYKGIVSGNADVECNVGAVELIMKGTQEDFNYEVDCKVGAVHVGDTSYAGLAGQKNINNKASKNMDIECNVGAVNVKFDNTI